MTADEKADRVALRRDEIRLLDGQRQMVAIEALAKEIDIAPDRMADILGLEHRYFPSWYQRGGN